MIKTRRYLVITRHINPTMLETLGNTFQINRLHTTQFAGEYSVPLRTEGGETLAYLSWQPRLPRCGSGARRVKQHQAHRHSGGKFNFAVYHAE